MHEGIHDKLKNIKSAMLRNTPIHTTTNHHKPTAKKKQHNKTHDYIQKRKTERYLERNSGAEDVLRENFKGID